MCSKQKSKTKLDPNIVRQLKSILDVVNPFVQQYWNAGMLISDEQISNLKLCLLSSRNSNGRRYNTPSASEIAALIVRDIDMNYNVRDIIVEQLCGKPKKISELHACYLPLQYPLLFPFGEDGYTDDIAHSDDSLLTTKKENRLSIREFFAFRLMTREGESSLILHADRLF